MATTPTMCKIKDYLEYTAQDIVSIIITGEGQAVITFLEPVESNGVKAKVKVFIDEELQYFSIQITPRNVDNFLLGSKKWLERMVDDYMADESDSPISLSYPWGAIGAIYVPDPHNGISGGEISIRYKDKKQKSQIITNRKNHHKNHKKILQADSSSAWSL